MNQHRRIVAKLKTDAKRSGEGDAEQTAFEFLVEDLKVGFGKWDRYDPVVLALLRVVAAQNDFASAILFSVDRYGLEGSCPAVEAAIDERIQAIDALAMAIEEDPRDGQ
jgi:hypothetical protein